MQKINLHDGLSHLEAFLIEKLQELCYNRSLDSYRAKHLNPKQSVKEFYELLNDWQANKIKDFKSILLCRDEVVHFLLNEETLIFDPLSKKGLIDSLKKVKDENSDLDLLEYRLFNMLANNNDYLPNLLDAIEMILDDPKEDEGDRIVQLKILDRLISYSITEAIQSNLTKSYLHKLIQAIFIFKEDFIFKDSWSQFKIILTKQEEIKFNIIFKVKASEKQLENLISEQITFEVDKGVVGESPQAKIQNFIVSRKGWRFLIFEVDALDYYHALKIGKAKLSKQFDRIHLGYSNLNLTLHETAAVINDVHKEKGNLQPLYYQIDGYYKSNGDQHRKFLSELEAIEENKNVKYEVKDRINSALRHLRLGNEALEIEKKFINYWIGLEFVFSNYDKDTSTFRRVMKFLPIIHSLYYVKRNLLHLHETLKTFQIDKDVEGFDDSLDYFKEGSTFDIIKGSAIGNHPLLAYRVQRLKAHLVNNSESRKKYLNRHKQNIEWHITRLYRIRNKIVHDAAIIDNLENLTGNLRYYLNFILNKLVEYFEECPPKPLDNKQIGMDDFFYHHLMLWEEVEKEKFDLGKLIHLKYTIEYLS
ncbi:hypothetical protein KIH41_17940 [Litoribacter ruber]|uniref:hypothetical protein n=1 Tax=Litoribacter ruber TaxID=702568 RepID=UPI001BD9DD7B|nr:hypothetical protein [Litoribacter ruber]MBT0813169.1 hypothetical protein [Litoribacter ruber]